MHRSALDKLAALLEGYLGDLRHEPLAILEVGSRIAEDEQTGQRHLLERGNWKCTGLDIEPGRNVDIAVKDPYRWAEIGNEAFDVVVCSQVFEHVTFPWLTMNEIKRVLKPSGLAFIIAPASGPEHRYPTDCWRIYPDGWRALAEHAELNAVEIYTQWQPLYYTDGSDKWQDSVLVAQKAPGAGGSAIEPLTDRGVLTAYAATRKKQAGVFPLRYKRRVIFGHVRGILREMFSL